MRYLLITLLLAVDFWCIGTAEACEHAATAEDLIVSSILQHHCCRLEIENSDRQVAGSENQTPCTCRSQSDEKMKTSVSIDSLRRYPDRGTSLQLNGLPATHMREAAPIVGAAIKKSTPIYLLAACLLI